MKGLFFLIIVGIVIFFLEKKDSQIERKHKEKERERLKISEEDYLKADKALKSPWLSREQQEEEIRRAKFEETKTRVLRESAERRRKEESQE